MQLRELVDNLEQLDDDQIICVVQPWSSDAEARLTPDDRLAVPDDVKRAGFAHDRAAQIRAAGTSFQRTARGARLHAARMCSACFWSAVPMSKRHGQP